jgi:hypothetical protein
LAGDSTMTNGLDIASPYRSPQRAQRTQRKKKMK